jgi:8-hydroxy-5-deazaflavin:NADPH oxidoreductase
LRVTRSPDAGASGDDDGAKAKVRELLESFGWPSDRILDLGDISGARGMEMYLPLWLRLFSTFGSGELNIHVARSARYGSDEPGRRLGAVVAVPRARHPTRRRRL